MAENKKCAVCDHPAQSWWWQQHAGLEVRCDYCGYYRIGLPTLKAFREQRATGNIDPLLPYLPAHIRQAKEPPLITADSWPTFAQSIQSRTTAERARKMLDLFKRRSNFKGAQVKFEPFDKPECDLGHDEEASYVIHYLLDLGLVATKDTGHVVTPKGWESDDFNRTQPRKIFLSHAAGDAVLAKRIADEIRKRLSKANVFVSSQPGDIATGEKWLEAIEKKLQGDDTFIILLTEASIERRWVWFEIGSIWFSGKNILPVVAAGLDRGEVPHPLSVRQALDLRDAAQLRQFFRDLQIEVSESEAGSLVDSFSAVESLNDSKWTTASFEGETYVWDGPLTTLPDWSAVPASKELMAFIERHGFRSRCSRPDALNRHFSDGYRQVWVSDLKTYKRPLSCHGPDLLWIIKATSQFGRED